MSGTLSKSRKEIESFVQWANNQNLKDTNGTIVHIVYEDVAKTFSEPSRNKLTAFIKHILNVYDIEDMDYNTILDSFKNKEAKVNFQVDSTIDTSETYYVDTFENVTYDDLVNIFGEPICTRIEPGVKNKYEWKLQGKNCVYTIYDWISTGEDFHIGTNKTNKTELQNLIEHIKSSVKIHKNVIDNDDASVIDNGILEDDGVSEINVTLDNIDFEDQC